MSILFLAGIAGVILVGGLAVLAVLLLSGKEQDRNRSGGD